MPQQKPSKPPTEYVDRPEVCEIFADGYEMMYFDGTSLRLEFTVSRYEKPEPPKLPSGTRYPACRLSAVRLDPPYREHCGGGRMS